MHAITEEGERAMMAMVGAKVRLRMSLAWLILIIAIAAGVLVFLLKMAHVFLSRGQVFKSSHLYSLIGGVS